MKRTIHTLHKKLGILLLGLLLLVAPGCGQVSNSAQSSADNTAQPIKIGWLGPLTGDSASIGQDALKASQLAVEEINSAGGVNGRPLELVAEDGQCDGKTAANAGAKLITSDQVPVIIGGECSGETLAVAPMAEQNKTVLFSPCSSAPAVTDAGDYTFRSYPSDNFQGRFAAEYVYNTLGKHTVAVLAVQSDWGQGIKGVFEQRFEELGGKIVADENFDTHADELRTPLAKIKAANPEVLYFLGETQSTLIGLKEAKELGLTIPIVGGDVWDDSKVWADPASSGALFVVPRVNVSDDWRAKLKAVGGDVTICAPGAYNNIKIIADIMGKVGTNGEAIKNALYQVHDYPGVNGPITLDQNGDLASATFGVKQIQNGKADFITN